jgi:hypothetical protein
MIEAVETAPQSSFVLPVVAPFCWHVQAAGPESPTVQII